MPLYGLHECRLQCNFYELCIFAARGKCTSPSRFASAVVSGMTFPCSLFRINKRSVSGTWELGRILGWILKKKKKTYSMWTVLLKATGLEVLWCTGCCSSNEFLMRIFQVKSTHTLLLHNFLLKALTVLFIWTASRTIVEFESFKQSQYFHYLLNLQFHGTVHKQNGDGNRKKKWSSET